MPLHIFSICLIFYYLVLHEYRHTLKQAMLVEQYCTETVEERCGTSNCHLKLILVFNDSSGETALPIAVNELDGADIWGLFC